MKKPYAEVAEIYSENDCSIHEVAKKENEIHSSFTVTPQTREVIATVHDQCLVKMEKKLNLRVEDMNKKCVLIDSNVLHQKALSLYKDFSKGSPEMSNTKPFTTSKDSYTDSGISWDGKIEKLLHRLQLLMKKSLPCF